MKRSMKKFLVSISFLMTAVSMVSILFGYTYLYNLRDKKILMNLNEAVTKNYEAGHFETENFVIYISTDSYGIFNSTINITIRQLNLATNYFYIDGKIVSSYTYTVKSSTK